VSSVRGVQELELSFKSCNGLRRNRYFGTFADKGEFITAKERFFTLNCYGLAIPLAFLSGVKGNILLVQPISTCLHGAYRKGAGGRHPVINA
jgi:hypothetical protein